MPSIENRMVMDSAWASYERRAEMLNEGDDHKPEPGPEPCQCCDDTIIEGGKTLCKACGYGELEALVFQMERYLKDHGHGQEEILKRFVYPMTNICKEVGSDA
jgi:hypothetical protein